MSYLVFKILKPSRTFHGIAYNEKKQKKGTARLLHFDHFGLLTDERTAISGKEAKKYLEHFSSANKRITNKQFHAIMSCKGKSMALEELKDHGLALMGRLGYGKNPVLVYGHNDTAHHHIHIITTRVDPDGKKIPHQFERTRANQILSEILNFDRGEEFQKKLSEFNSYTFSTPAQFQLLWELQGYRTKKTNADLEIYKYGTLMGKIDLLLLQKQMDSWKADIKTPSKIRALIHKYKNQYSTTWQKRDSGKYTTQKKLLQTPLTDFLHQRFGLQFMFFKNLKHDSPYGYAVIDHPNKAIYKGGEVMRLENLLSADPAVEIKPGPGQVRQQEDSEPVAAKQETAFTSQTNINLGLDYYIDQLEREAEKEQSHAYDPQRRKRGKFI